MNGPRVAVVGTSCSGKTTLARSLSPALGVPHVELDALHWGPDWIPHPTDQFVSRVAEAVAAPAWVVDGNYRAVRDLVWARATHVVWLDYPFPLVFRRALGRTLRRLFTRERLFAGNRERVLAFLDPDWIPWWVARTHRRRRREYGARIRLPEYAHLQVLHLTDPARAERLLDELIQKRREPHDFFSLPDVDAAREGAGRG